MSPAPTTEILRDRAHMLQRARDFFAKRNVLEVDCCALRPYAAIDANIDAIDATPFLQKRGFLHTSPEYAMKRLLAQGIGDIYYLGHVFRQGDLGRLHNPEFAMAEWYRLGFSFFQMMQETSDFISLFLNPLPIRILGFKTIFADYLKIDYAKASLTDLQDLATFHGANHAEHWPRDVCLHFLLSQVIEPKLGENELTIVTDYPPQEAALASVIEKEGEKVAERFEIYHKGIELANGYCELNDPLELRRRFTEENLKRSQNGKETYYLDECFLQAIKKLPECCGVSVGFDRLLMLRHNTKTIGEVLPFAWEVI